MILLLCLGPAGAVAAAEQVEIFQLQGQTAETLIPVIEPLAGDAVLSGIGTRLIVRATPARMAQIRDLIEQLDTPPRRLLIEVSNDRAVLTHNRSLDVDGGIRVGGDTVEGTGTVDIRARVEDARTESKFSRVHRIQAVAGQRAFIATGQTVPRPRPSVTIVDNTVVERNLVTDRHVASGFEVVPLVSGDQVTVRILQYDDRIGASARDTIDTQFARTVLRGRIGEWLEVGGVSGAARRGNEGLTRYRGTRRTSDRTVLLRVLTLD